MTVGRTSGWMDPSWFKYVDIPGIDSGKMKYGVLKDECRDQFREAVQARREEVNSPQGGRESSSG